METWNDRFAEALKKAGFNHEVPARAAGVTPQTISGWVNKNKERRTKKADATELWLACDSIGADIKTILFGEQEVLEPKKEMVEIIDVQTKKIVLTTPQSALKEGTVAYLMDDQTFEPNIQMGELILIDPNQTTLFKNALYLIKYDGEYLLRRYFENKIKKLYAFLDGAPIHSDYTKKDAFEMILEDVEIIGKAYRRLTNGMPAQF